VKIVFQSNIVRYKLSHFKVVLNVPSRLFYMIHHGACFFELEPRWRLTPHVFSPSSQQPAVLEDATALFGPPLETPFGEQKTEGESLPFWSVCFYVHIHVKFELWIFEPVWVVIAGSSVARRWGKVLFFYAKLYFL